jgi:hypothetical protein
MQWLAVSENSSFILSWVALRAGSRRQRPTLKQNVRRPPVPKEPDLADVKSAS